MMSAPDESLTPVLGLASGRTIGGEPTFTFPEVLDAIALCTHHEIVVLGLELFQVCPTGYHTEKISPYEVQLKGQTWREFVALNNSLAAEFVRQNQSGDDHFYLLTASTQEEYPGLISR
jgi:hypothetical protein